MKRALALIIAIILIASAFILSSCAYEKEDYGAKIVCTQFSAYDWAKNITAGTDAEVMLLTDNGADIHSFQPSARDIVDIASADLFIYVGGVSEEWAEDVLATSAKDVRRICLTESVEGVCLHHDEEHNDHEHRHETDEHVWLSIKNARTIARDIYKELAEVFPENKAVYEANLGAYDGELSQLEEEYYKVTAEARKEALLFAGRFPFIYLTKELGLKYYAAFDGCSAETEASFETIMELSAIADDLGLESAIVIKGDDRSLAETIGGITQKGLNIIEMDALQSVTPYELDAGKSYISAMRENLWAMKSALG